MSLGDGTHVGQDDEQRSHLCNSGREVPSGNWVFCYTAFSFQRESGTGVLLIERSVVILVLTLADA